jgi:hypothetical protein
MEILFYILVFFACLLCIVNTVILFFLSIVVINLRDKLKEFFSDLVQMLAASPLPFESPERKNKTWDEKYEEELIERERRRQAELDQTFPIL